MKSENKRLLEAFEYLDEKYIDELFDVLDTPPRRGTAGSGKRSYWYIPVLAACLLLMAFASPIANYVVEAINSFAAGWGSGTTEVLTETESLNSTENETTNDTDIYITTELHESVITPNYLKFVPDLEPISEEKMLEIRKAWSEKQREYWFNNYYLTYSYNTDKYTEAEARAKATQKADKAAKEAEYVWFVLSVYNDKGDVPHRYRYYGMIDDYVVLVECRITTFNYSDEILYKKIGDHTFYFKAGGEIYLYKDGVFATMKDVYDQGLISDDDVRKIANRHVSYEASYEKWRKDAYYQYFAELTE